MEYYINFNMDLEQVIIPDEMKNYITDNSLLVKEEFFNDENNIVFKNQKTGNRVLLNVYKNDVIWWKKNIISRD